MSKTLQERLIAAEATVAKLVAAIASANILTDIQTGDKVTIKYGRAETSRLVEGTVVGVKQDDKGIAVAVLSEDFKSYTVAARDITVNHSKVERDAANADTSDVDGEAVIFEDQDALAAADPLLAE